MPKSEFFSSYGGKKIPENFYLQLENSDSNLSANWPHDADLLRTHHADWPPWIIVWSPASNPLRVLTERARHQGGEIEEADEGEEEQGQENPGCQEGKPHLHCNSIALIFFYSAILVSWRG